MRLVMRSTNAITISNDPSTKVTPPLLRQDDVMMTNIYRYDVADNLADALAKFEVKNNENPFVELSSFLTAAFLSLSLLAIRSGL